MYIIGDLDFNESFEKKFSTFNEAFIVQQAVRPHNKIYSWNNNEHSVVWDPAWENMPNKYNDNTPSLKTHKLN